MPEQMFVYRRSWLRGPKQKSPILFSLDTWSLIPKLCGPRHLHRGSRAFLCIDTGKLTFTLDLYVAAQGISDNPICG